MIMPEIALVHVKKYHDSNARTYSTSAPCKATQGFGRYKNNNWHALLCTEVQPSVCIAVMVKCDDFHQNGL